MENNLIIFSTITQVMKSRDLLRKYNIFSKVVRTPTNLRIGSCGYSLFVPKNIGNVIAILKNNNISFIGTTAVDLK